VGTQTGSTMVTALAGVCLVLALDAVRAQAPVLETKSLLEGRVTLLIPRGFEPMSAELLVRKYPSANRPNLVYSNAATTINVALEHTVHRIQPAQLAAAHQSIRTTFSSAYPSAEWFRSEVRAINGRQFFLLDVRTPAVDTIVRNIIVGTSLDDRLLMVSFNVTKALEGEWLAAGNRIIESITVK
jgi:hypothetical protein